MGPELGCAATALPLDREAARSSYPSSSNSSLANSFGSNLGRLDGLGPDVEGLDRGLRAIVEGGAEEDVEDEATAG